MWKIVSRTIITGYAHNNRKSGRYLYTILGEHGLCFLFFTLLVRFFFLIIMPDRPCRKPRNAQLLRRRAGKAPCKKLARDFWQMFQKHKQECAISPVLEEIHRIYRPFHSLAILCSQNKNLTDGQKQCTIPVVTNL